MAYDGNSIFALNPADPTGSEAKSLGDNAIREIKRALKNAFPNTTEGDAYTGTLSQLNSVVAQSAMPTNSVVAYGGSITVSPPGWTICDGRIRPGGAFSPDLRGVFIRGAGGFIGLTTRGGDAELLARAVGSSVFTNYTTAGTALSVAQLPNNLGVSCPLSNGGGGNDGITHTSTAQFAGGDGSTDNTVTRNIAGTTGAAHSHTFQLQTVNTQCNIPPYYALAYIIKD